MKKFFFLFFVCLAAILWFTPLVARAAADLNVIDMTFSPAKPAVDKKVVVTVTVKNSGTTDFSANVDLQKISYTFPNFTVSGIVYPQLSGDILAPNASVIYTIEGSFSKAGSTELTFNFDPNQTIAESAEANNIVKRTVEVLTSEEDLQAASIAVLPASPAVDQAVVVTVKVLNNGTRTLNSSDGVINYTYTFENFFLTKSTQPTVNLSSTVAPGGYVIYVFEGRFTKAGQAALVFTADAGDKVFESNETNNSLTKSITVLGKEAPDLQVESITLNVDEPIVTDSVTITMKVKNKGTSSLISDYGLTSYDVTTDFGGFSISSTTTGILPSLTNPLDPDETLTYTYIGGFGKTGENILTFTVNDKGRLSETDTGNNTLSKTVTIFISEAARDDFAISNKRVEAISSSSVAILWDTDKISTGKITSGVGSDTALATTGSGTKHTATLKNLLSGNFYSYRIVAAKNSIVKESFIDFTVPGDDNISFTTSPVAVVDPVSKKVTIFWTTNLRGTAKIFYKTESSAAFAEAPVIPSNSGAALIQSASIAPTVNGTYSYYVLAQSMSAAQATSQPKQFVIAYAASNKTNTAPATTTAPAIAEMPKTPAGEPTAASQSQNQQSVSMSNQTIYNELRGKILLKVADKGKAYYVNPVTSMVSYLGRPDDAFAVMRSQGVGITSADLVKIPVGFTALSGPDTDGDGLPDALEDALGTDENNSDTDGDDYSDKMEIENNYSPLTAGTLPINMNFVAQQKGKILLQVQEHGEAWYVNPTNGKRYFLGRPADAFSVMRTLGLGISNEDFERL
ncbi:hypothetical protein A2477_03360 [Candidatus Falkowbacteria bacterium RIFOXYC2_FULL_47_12]|uniref:CARDB domain-containing protein n=2 Tax=Candidatus Falkowiibacteriota TaxID=1752728 RepID=A0A1F5TNL8_9BACT|nr:MAG: hypothetical protein A2242_04150 [Candidatus Falkowbacteria bacterium RIFOXYA2_FULL_47_9]OGF40553.1 MAG: hypothetical protein A2477_03360 [Candidatus Falkowbacteria bacterium RIFOXYC2_FULL_47_12]